MNFERYVPKKIPITERAVKGNKKAQSTWIFDKSPKNPIRD